MCRPNFLNRVVTLKMMENNDDAVTEYQKTKDSALSSR